MEEWLEMVMIWKEEDKRVGVLYTFPSPLNCLFQYHGPSVIGWRIHLNWVVATTLTSLAKIDVEGWTSNNSGNYFDPAIAINTKGSHFHQTVRVFLTA